MDIRKIKSIVKRISKIYGVENFYKVSRTGKDKFEIRTELPSYEGGEDMSRELEALKPGYICENLGGCVYCLYRPL